MDLDLAIDQLDKQLADEKAQPVQQQAPPILGGLSLIQREYVLSFWRFLQKLDGSSPYISALPGNNQPNWQWDGILLSPGGTYIFHLLPYHLDDVVVQPQVLQYTRSSEEQAVELFLGKSRELIHKIQAELKLKSLPVYELYLVPEAVPDVCIVMEQTLIMSYSKLSSLFQNYLFRENEINQEIQKKMYNYLKQADSHLVGNENGSWGTGVSESSVGNVDNILPTEQEDYKGTLPPRQSRRKKHAGSWLHRLVGK